FRCFFQAEDGIRGFHVTGVQTCALPICQVALEVRARVGVEDAVLEVLPVAAGADHLRVLDVNAPVRRATVAGRVRGDGPGGAVEIGRASWRGRAAVEAVGGATRSEVEAS